ncbi:MAG: hypothetical protein AB7E49_08505 [Campylobacterales bacterium]
MTKGLVVVLSVAFAGLFFVGCNNNEVKTETPAAVAAPAAVEANTTEANTSVAPTAK